jgi:Cu/Ag efflux pump CusA
LSLCPFRSFGLSIRRPFSAIAGVGIILLLSIVTRSWRNLLLILANLPFALVGGVLAVFLTGGLLSLGGLVGFVTLFGITLRNSILMIAHYEHLVQTEGMQWARPPSKARAIGSFPSL